MTNNELKEKIATRLIERIEQIGEPIWLRPWAFEGLDVSFKTGKEYQGINTLLLNIERAMEGFKSKVWLTMNNINELQGKKWDDEQKRYVRTSEQSDISLRKGSHAVPVIYWNQFVVKDEDGNEVVDEKTGKKKVRWFLKTYNVFNASCVDGLDVSSKEPDPKGDKATIESCEKFEEQILATYKGHPVVKHAGNRAYYVPSRDYIVIPESRMFGTKVDEYVSTLAHELAHSTGHVSRLNREMKNRFGSEKYAFEELVAETTATMVCAYYGVDRGFDNSANYLKGWLEHLKKNPSAFFEAIEQAKKAFDVLMGTTRMNETVDGFAAE